jgi:hypothetical protein
LELSNSILGIHAEEGFSRLDSISLGMLRERIKKLESKTKVIWDVPTDRMNLLLELLASE